MIAKGTQMSDPTSASKRSDYKNLQVRLLADDAKRFIRLAEDRGHTTVQDSLVEAIKIAMAHWGDGAAIENPGAKKAGKLSQQAQPLPD